MSIVIESVVSFCLLSIISIYSLCILAFTAPIDEVSYQGQNIAKLDRPCQEYPHDVLFDYVTSNIFHEVFEYPFTLVILKVF